MNGVLLSLFVIALTKGSVENNHVEDECHLPEVLLKEIRSYQPIADKIIDAVTKGEHKGKTYNELALFVDKFGARQAGSHNLEDSIDFLLQKLPSFHLDNVHGENVTVPHWIR